MDLLSDKKDEDSYLPFQGLEKGLVLQEVRMFSSPKLKTKDCYYLLTKILYLSVAKGETFTSDEATNVFISVTKLFQSKDTALRRMMYLLLKELTQQAEDTIIAFATLIKDVNSDVEMNRANAIRVISGIMDATMLGQMERYLKQAIVDKEPYVASSALVAGLHLADQALDIIKKWITEVQEALNSRNTMVQYHALGLLHKIKRKDKLAVTKLVTVLADSGTLRSHFAHCLLIRFAVEVLEESHDGRDERLFHYLETCLRHKSDIVVYEAARAICGLKNIKLSELGPAVAVLQIFLGSLKATLRFAAVRTLNKVATTHPEAIIGSCAFEMENLISDTNRSVATLAITTLLKVEQESSVEKLMKQISNFINDISDEFKVVVVDAIRTLAMKYPEKHYSIMNFLSTMLRDEGGLEYKSTIVNTILTIIERIPQSTDLALDHLCEFIEDCEYTNLSTKVLHLLGKQGPKSSNPSRYIRYIYNRISLENATVRAAAVTALAKFGVHRHELRDKIRTLLKRSLQDGDDEVRDRATFYVKILQPANGSDDSSVTTLPLAGPLLQEELHVPLDNLQSDLLAYLENPSDNPFDINSVSTKTKNLPTIETPGGKPSPAAAVKKPQAAPQQRQNYAQQLLSIPQLANLGELLNSTPPLYITESDPESSPYQVRVIKHIFPGHIVLQYPVTNTMQEQVLRNLTLEMGIKENEFSILSIIPATEASYHESGDIYAIIKRPSVKNTEKDFKFLRANIWNNLRFYIHNIDSKTNQVNNDGFPEEFQLDEVQIKIADFMSRQSIPNFSEIWAQTDNNEEFFQAINTFSLSMVNSIKDGVNEIIKVLGMGPCENSHHVADNATKHILLLSGRFVELGGIPVLAKVRMRFSPQQGVGMELTVRSQNKILSDVLSDVFFT